MPIFSFWSSDPSPTSPSSPSQTQPPSQTRTPDGQAQQACPVDHKSREAWLAAAKSAPAAFDGVPHNKAHAEVNKSFANQSELSFDREISSIPRGFLGEHAPTISDPSTEPSNPQSASHGQSSNNETQSSLTRDGKWLYPSESQFFAAMSRKNLSPQARDMRTVIPIHNAVNERAWAAILAWEQGRGGEACGGPRLVSFAGDSTKTSPKAWALGVMGYKRPFDRHDWVLERCGTRVEYVIDFYEGKGGKAAMPLSFYIDARPKLNTFEGCRMRVAALFGF